MAPFGQSPCGDSGTVAGKEVSQMKSSILKNCIATLEKLRDVYESQLDARVLAELDEVIANLKKKARDGEQDDVRLGILSLRALELIEYVIKLVTNVTELMK
jgi:hypothetical protein